MSALASLGYAVFKTTGGLYNGEGIHLTGAPEMDKKTARIAFRVEEPVLEALENLADALLG